MDEQKLSEMYEFTKENNHMLKAMRRDAFIGGIIKFIVWVVLFIVLPYIAWLFIQPYLQGVLDTYQNVQKTTSAVSNTTSVNLSKLDELLKKFGGGQ
ncbi:MAG: hypothetical protein WC880_04720 [Candidatus Paceibacterota bacterium]